MSSHALSQSRRILLDLCAAFFILVSGTIFSASAQAQSRPTPSPNATPNVASEDQKLNEARRRNEDAQAAYYRAQTEKLNQPVPAKSFWRTLSDNAAILGALTAALVALFTLIVNQRTALRARKDTEFYEALKRFGDKDSPTVRASAAAMLAQISGTWFYNLPRRRQGYLFRGKQRLKLLRRLARRLGSWLEELAELLKAPRRELMRRVVTYPYFDTALDQLITGLSIEEHPIVVAAITDSVARLIPKDAARTLNQLYVVNQRLQIQFAEELAWLIALFADHSDWKESGKVWEVACSYTGYARASLKDLPDFHETEFNVALQEASLTVATTAPLSEFQDPIKNRVCERLKAIGSRLRQNVALFERSFENHTEGTVYGLHRAFLANINFLWGLDLRGISLSGAILINASFHSANLNRADLSYAHLENADLSHSRLEGARLSSAKLEGTRLNGAVINKETRVDESIWKANFGEYDSNFDPELIASIVALIGAPSAQELREAHPSVRKYFAVNETGPTERD